MVQAYFFFKKVNGFSISLEKSGEEKREGDLWSIELLFMFEKEG